MVANEITGEPLNNRQKTGYLVFIMILYILGH